MRGCVFDATPTATPHTNLHEATDEQAPRTTIWLLIRWIRLRGCGYLSCEFHLAGRFTPRAPRFCAANPVSAAARARGPRAIDPPSDSADNNSSRCPHSEFAGWPFRTPDTVDRTFRARPSRVGTRSL